MITEAVARQRIGTTVPPWTGLLRSLLARSAKVQRTVMRYIFRENFAQMEFTNKIGIRGAPHQKKTF